MRQYYVYIMTKEYQDCHPARRFAAAKDPTF